jgi:hypothetical protein
MPTIDLRQDAVTFRRGLEVRIGEIVSENGAPVCAVEVGYDCGQGGWVFVHADRRNRHQRDGKWTSDIRDDNVIPMPHWAEAVEARFEGEVVTVQRHDGSSFVVPAFDEDAEEDPDSEDPFAAAVGEMLLDVLTSAKADGVLRILGPAGTIQLDIEDFNGTWAWPEYDDLGKTNMA